MRPNTGCARPCGSAIRSPANCFTPAKTIAKSLGLEWGAYHVARPGNPIDQANHFLDFAEPESDDLMALDLEGLDTEQWMSLQDAEIFVRHIKYRTGRYPILYANDVTAQYIAANKDRYRLLSRLPLWYARYRPEIGRYFPKGHWQRYALWQFSPHRPTAINGVVRTALPGRKMISTSMSRRWILKRFANTGRSVR